ncbi:sialate O-acetylesterase [Zobellia galactanivorans]|uniref:Alpha-galactosidase n=1 Tax=Zobellia galactanivorans (strain DSM 12802 / CCUG 47099 / CIP 106680 / NCIMB 13871 / Dsij) TaxID=63186 RepID=G0L8L5_ZOBGA|nr:sialate O-acetylesterase [Zobellia galactanivorans]CAZ97661.1 Carbohydrate esterase, family CE6 / Alpha-galactosidase, family GH27 [Zobellia galactanivorans]
MTKSSTNPFFTSLLLLLFLSLTRVAAQEPVKVFILAGQSNMQGHGEMEKGEKGNLKWVVANDKNGEFQHLKSKDGKWSERDDVFIYTWDKFDAIKTGRLSTGYGAFKHTIGPELEFGNVMGDHFKNKVLLIKTAWGGKSLAVDFCPPSAAGEQGYNRVPSQPKDTGYYYVQMMSTVYKVLRNLDQYVPGYKGEGYEVSGFGWHQGWNDRANKKANAAYESNLKHLIKDVRNDLGSPELPFVIATTGMKGWEDKNPLGLSLMNAQLAMADYPEFKENVAVVETRDFWRDIEDSPSKQIYHWCRNAESYLLVGKSMANAMLDLLDSNKKFKPVVKHVATYNSDYLTPTPPMGWNSWNAFEKDIDEKKIMNMADIMVTSGMRDAGYEYLVIDDAWMAAERNEAGQLVADPVKFPGGMKAIGDYIHSKGLKYGIYECRGDLTCQNLPGSFEHEQTDMDSFASWGVDYIKLDACFAIKNGRLSSEDLDVYHQAIVHTRRPMVLSISDFGSGAWAWGGKNYGQLWRTSGDIYPTIRSVYNCANTSGGDGSIHPAFQGLWQFAGPDSWNDPDMLQVGNLKTTLEDKVHFSLWSILAAPIMAGNDLSKMTEETKKILLAAEVIAINQDARAHQGYKVFDKDSVEIYNKPLSDGTTAVLMLNKGSKKTDITVQFNTIGLQGKQKVRDVWLKNDLGEFDNSFTANGLGKHEHVLLKIGSKGATPVKGPAPIPEEAYTVTQAGITYLSDIYYMLKKGNAPVMDANFNGKPIKIKGRKYKKGLGAKSKSSTMYRLNGKAARFKAIVSLDKSSPKDATGQFKVMVEERFGGRVLFDSKKMKRGDKIEIDIDVKGLDFILLEFTGKKVFGNWGDAHVIAP